MEKCILDNGFIIKCGDLEKQHGPMEDLMRVGITSFNYRYKDDKKHGLGTFIWNDGRKYIGEWREGK